MKNKMKWLCAFLVFCLTAACMTACNSKGDFATAKTAMDKTLALETFQLDGTFETWSSTGEYGMDPGDIGMDSAGIRGKVEFSESLLTQGENPSYYIESSLIYESPTKTQTDTRYWYEDGYMYIVAEPTQFIGQEPSDEGENLVQFDYTMEDVVIAFDMRQWIAQFDDSQIIKGSMEEQEDGSLVYRATLKGGDLLPDVLGRLYSEDVHKDVQVSVKIEDGFATEMDFHYIFADEANSTDLNCKVHYIFTNLGSGVEIPERPQGEYTTSSSWDSNKFGLF